jgi:hypothetical protein
MKMNTRKAPAAPAAPTACLLRSNAERRVGFRAAAPTGRSG